MDQKINLGEVTIVEFNTIMKQLNKGELGECMDLFMRFRGIAEAFAKAQQSAPPQE